MKKKDEKAIEKIPARYLVPVMKRLFDLYREDKCQDLMELMGLYWATKDIERLPIIRTMAEFLDPVRVGKLRFHKPKAKVKR